MPSPRTLAIALALATLAAAPGSAQVYASERALVTQVVNGTTFTVEYYRPRARGRELFGKVVPWGRAWTPGANWATTLEVDRDVVVEGQPLPKGKYSLWAVPRPDAWTLAFHRTARVFHTRVPGADDRQLEVTLTPAVGPHVEMLTFSFPLVTPDSAELHLQWGTTDVALRVGIDRKAIAAAEPTAAERAMYVGTYRMTNLLPNARVREQIYTVKDSAGVLRLHRSHPPDTFYDAQFDLHRIGEHTFVPIGYRGGVLIGAEPAVTIVFTVENGRATGIENRFATGAANARGTRERAPDRP